MAKSQPRKTDPAKTAAADRPPAPDPTLRKPADPSEASPATGAPGGQTAWRQDEAQPSPDEESTSPESLRAELEEARHRALRLQAELENYRKRAAREMQEERRYANLPLMRDLLPVLDNMARAIEATQRNHDAAGLLEGVKMVARQLEDALQRHHCVRIVALNEPFDPHLHEAISQQPSDQHPAGTVLLETQSGFQLHDRVVRPSQVIVAGDHPSTEDSPPEAEDKEPS